MTGFAEGIINAVQQQINLGNIVGLLRQEEEPIKRQILWAKIIDNATGDSELRFYDFKTNKWTLLEAIYRSETEPPEKDVIWGKITNPTTQAIDLHYYNYEADEWQKMIPPITGEQIIALINGILGEEWQLGGGNSGSNLTATQIKQLYEGNADTNPFTDAEKDKLVNLVLLSDSDIKVAYERNSNTNAFTDAEKAKLATVFEDAEPNLTGAFLIDAMNTALGGSDWQSGGGALTDTQVKTAYENNSDTNAFTDALKAKLEAIQAGAEVNATGETLKSLINLAVGNTNWQSGSPPLTDGDIKVAYERNSDTNAFTDAEKSKLDSLTSGGGTARLYEKLFVGNTITGDGEDTGLTCNLAITGSILLRINGQTYILDENSKTELAYFSKDGGSTATNDFDGAKLYWNQSIATYPLETTDLLTFSNF